MTERGSETSTGKPTHTIPATVDVGPFTYTVSTDEIDILRAQDKEKTGLWGHTDHTKLKIVIGTVDESEMRQRVTLAHEWLHTLTSTAGLVGELTCDVEEKVVERLAPLLVDGLRRNPALVAYLTAK